MQPSTFNLQHSYTDGNGTSHTIAPGTLRPAPEVGAGFFAARRADGTLIIIHRKQIVERSAAVPAAADKK